VSRCFNLPIECLLWINWLSGGMGSYSPRSERFAYVDVLQERAKFHGELVATPTTRREIVRRFGIDLPIIKGFPRDCFCDRCRLESFQDAKP
jgi:hypothetical protein